jgi:tol-pal system protein YbgF
MVRKSFLSVFIFSLFSQVLPANGQGYDSIIQRQSKQIRELKGRVLDLEDDLEEVKLVLKNAGLLINKTPDKTSDGHDDIVGEADSNDVSKSKKNSAEDNNFFSNNLSDSKKTDKTDYDLALATLKEGDFSAAETKFSDFIVKYPTSGLQSNATFWYAETFYRRGIYDKAAINYLQSYKKYPKASKAPDALLKLSYSLASLNKQKEACSMLAKLESEFPKRPIGSIKRANEARVKFHCK